MNATVKVAAKALNYYCAGFIAGPCRLALLHPGTRLEGLLQLCN